MSPGFVVRAIAPGEYDRAGEITEAAYREVGETEEAYFPELHDVATRATLATVFVAAEEGTGRILGNVTYVPGPGPYFEGAFGDDAAAFRMLAVAGEAQGRGVGRALVARCIERARREGRTSIGIYTRPFMHAAHRLYSSFGFERVPELDWEFEPGECLFAYRLFL